MALAELTDLRLVPPAFHHLVAGDPATAPATDVLELPAEGRGRRQL
jgi:hypothetical protein